MTVSRIMPVVLSLAIGAALGGAATFFWLEEWSDHEHADAGNATQPPEDQPEHDDHEIVEVSDEWLERFEVELAAAGPGELVIEVVLPGEVQINPDAAAHVTPVVAGVARDVFKGLGDEVKAGELLAVLESRELAEAKAECLAANERLRLAAANLERELRLREKKISTEKEFLEARQAEAMARIDRELAEQRLQALGVSQAEYSLLLQWQMHLH